MEEEGPQNVQLSNDDADTNEGLGVCNYILVVLASIFIVVTFPFSLLCALKVLQEYERGIVLRLGRVVSNRPKGPGLIFVFPCIDELRIVDVRTFYYDIQPQKILTRDSMTVTVDAVVYARLINARQGALSGNIPLLTGRWTAAALCEVLAAKTLMEILGDREKITKMLSDTLYRQSYRRGVQIERVEIKNVRLPPEMQRAMAVEAETDRDAKAKVIAANGEMKASQALKQAADIINLSPAALKLRYLQTLHSVAAENNTTIVLPLPEGLPERLLAWLASRFNGGRGSTVQQRHERRPDHGPSRQVQTQEQQKRIEDRREPGHDSRQDQGQESRTKQRREQGHDSRQGQKQESRTEQRREPGHDSRQGQKQESRTEQRREQGHDSRQGQKQESRTEQRREQGHDSRQRQKQESRTEQRREQGHDSRQGQKQESRTEQRREQGHGSRQGQRQESSTEQTNTQRRENEQRQSHEQGREPRHGQVHQQKNGQSREKGHEATQGQIQQTDEQIHAQGREYGHRQSQESRQELRHGQGHGNGQNNGQSREQGHDSRQGQRQQSRNEQMHTQRRENGQRQSHEQHIESRQGQGHGHEQNNEESREQGHDLRQEPRQQGQGNVQKQVQMHRQRKDKLLENLTRLNI